MAPAPTRNGSLGYEFNHPFGALVLIVKAHPVLAETPGMEQQNISEHPLQLTSYLTMSPIILLLYIYFFTPLSFSQNTCAEKVFHNLYLIELTNLEGKGGRQCLVSVPYALVLFMIIVNVSINIIILILSV